MNILFVHSANDLYGSGKSLINVVKIALKKGYKCYVILPAHGALNDYFKELDVEVYIKDIGIIRRKYFNLFGLINRFFKILISQGILYRIIKKNNINLVYSNTTAVLSPAIITKLLKLKHIWHIHEILLYPKLFVKLIAFLLDNFSTYCIAVSKSVQKHWIDLGVNKNKIKIIYNAINTSEFKPCNNTLLDELNPKKNDIVMGMIARVHYWKGQDYFLEIAGRLIKYKSNIKFIMVGDAFPGYEYIYKKLDLIKSKYNLKNMVLDLGFREDIPEILAVLDVFILPSIQPDPLPTTVLEAMASSKAVVATNHGGATEMIIDGETGILIPWNDPETAAKKILPLLEDVNLRKKMGLKGFERVTSHFSPIQFEKNIAELFEILK
jgi:glycosyltransferase involved in cell wall biosynthesis